MEFILEILTEIILDGSLEIVQEMKVPMVLRILAGMILLTVYGGLAVLGIMLTVNGIQENDVPLILCGLFLTGLMIAFAVMAYRKWSNRS